MMEVLRWIWRWLVALVKLATRLDGIETGLAATEGRIGNVSGQINRLTIYTVRLSEASRAQQRFIGLMDREIERLRDRVDKLSDETAGKFERIVGQIGFLRGFIEALSRGQ